MNPCYVVAHLIFYGFTVITAAFGRNGEGYVLTGVCLSTTPPVHSGEKMGGYPWSLVHGLMFLVLSRRIPRPLIPGPLPRRRYAYSLVPGPFPGRGYLWSLVSRPFPRSESHMPSVTYWNNQVSYSRGDSSYSFEFSVCALGHKFG